MSFFRVLSPNGTGLVCDRNAYSLNYLGKATLQSVNQADGNQLTGAGRKLGFCVYTFATPINPVMAFVSMPFDRTVYLEAAGFSGGVHTFGLYCQGAPVADGTFSTNYGDAEVFVFGRLTTASGVGLKMRNDAGQLTHVFTDTDGPPLRLTGSVFDGTTDIVTPKAIPAMSKPAIMGWSSSTRIQIVSAGSGFFHNYVRRFGWTRRAGQPNTVYLNDITVRRFLDDGGNNVTFPYDCTAFLLDAGGL